jgi:hypothetical protein
MKNFFFDEWSDLYKNNPEEFERRRKEVLDEVINNAPEHLKAELQSIQRRCDIIRKLNTPLDATIEISGMMIDSVRMLESSFVKLKDILSKEE